MSAISLKSITGITSITTPAGVDNVFTVHTNDTTERFRVDQTGNLNIAGIVTVTKDLDVDGHTNLDNVSVAGVTTFVGNVNIENDTGKIQLGASQDLQFYHDFSGGSENSHIRQTTNKHLQITAYTTFNRISGTWGVIKDSNSHNIIRATAGSDVKLYFNNGEKLATTNTGINITGTAVATGADINGDLDVDGHTNLDNVSIAGITTFSNATTMVNGGYHRGIINSGAQAKIIGGYISGSDTLRLGESMYLTTTGLGIGVASPGRKFHISPGQIKLENTSTGSWAGLDFLCSSGTNNYDAYMGVQDSDGLFFIDNNSNGIDFCITQGGNIGAGGITSPLWTSGGGIHLNDNYGIGFGNGGSGRPDFQLMVTDGSKLEFRCGFGADTADIVMDTSGRLLVGTTSQSISSNELFEVKSTGGGFSHFRNNSSGYAPIYIDNEATNDGETLVPLITITDGGGNRAGLLLNNSSVFDISGQGAVTLSTGGTVGNATEILRITSGGNIETKGLGTFEFNDGWSAEGRNVVVFPYNDSSNWFSFVGTGLRFTDGGNFVKPSDQGNSNWGNISGIVFEGSNNGTDPALRFVVDQPGGNGNNYSLGSGSSGKTAAIDNKTAAYVAGNGNFIFQEKIGLGAQTSPNGTLDIRTTDDDDAIRLVNTSTGNNGIQWWNEYGGLTKRVSMDYGEGDANFDIRCFRADGQDNRPYGNVRIMTGSYSNPTTNFRVTTLGSVHMPNQPSFSASDTAGHVYGGNPPPTMVFNNADFNVGNHYDTSNGIFTAPIAGKYQFSFCGMAAGGTGDFQVRILKNGGGYFNNNGSGRGYGTFEPYGFTVLMDLAINETVQIKIYSSNTSCYIYAGFTWNRFSGYLIG